MGADLPTQGIGGPFFELRFEAPRPLLAQIARNG